MTGLHSAGVVALIPAYNCQRTIGAVVGAVRAQGLEVLVVDDGSRDDTAGAARAAGAWARRLPQNRGKGHALWTGFSFALSRGAEFVVTLDGDGQHDPGDLPALLGPLPGADLVLGRRQLDRAHMPPGRLFGNRFSSWWINLMCRADFPDTQCGYRVYSRRLLQALPRRGGHFETETELLMRASLLGLAVSWVPVSTIYDDGSGGGPPVSNFDNWVDTVRMIVVVLSSPLYPRRRARC